MPKRPNGEKCPADVGAAAVLIAQIATGEAEESAVAVPGRRRGGLAGAAVRLVATTEEERMAIAKKAAVGRWGR